MTRLSFEPPACSSWFAGSLQFRCVCWQWEEDGEVPLQLLQLAAREGLYGFQWPEEYGGTPPQDFDAFHESESPRLPSAATAADGLWQFDFLG